MAMATARGGAMIAPHRRGSGRRRRVEADPTPSIGLDARVCECCDTDLAMTERRARSWCTGTAGPNEERDIFIVRQTAEGWTTSGAGRA